MPKNTIETVGVVTKVIKETLDTHTVRVTMSNLKDNEKPFKFEPGQFVMVKPVINGKKKFHVHIRYHQPQQELKVKITLI